MMTDVDLMKEIVQLTLSILHYFELIAALRE